MDVISIPHSDQTFYLQVLKLDQCALIYIGDHTSRMDKMNLVHLRHT